MEKVIAMYDVRGIQKYIYRTQKVKDAMGASALVENIMEDALKTLKNDNMKLEWHDENGVLPFEEGGYDIQVLFIGGGNAYVLFRDRETCMEVNKMLSRYVLEKTYSLQLAAACVPRTDNYSNDYKNLHEEMNRIKASIKSARPIGALPVMRTEIKTGYPLAEWDDGEYVSTETHLKKQYKRDKHLEEEEKIFDNLVTKKGEDSNIAVVHIDGNNMGMRIRKMIEDKTGYADAVDEMRKISYNIRYSYLGTFNEMKNKFDVSGDGRKWIRKIVVAGDDITYVCNAQIALDTVEYFAKKIAGCSMSGKTEDIEEYGFSICAGVAYMKSHFPFSVAYDVAEACCDSAKDRAKSAENMDGKRIGNYVDFQICKSVQCRNLEEMRRKEYVTPMGEQLLIRPYYIPTEHDGGLAKKRDVIFHYESFKDNVRFFLNEGNIPRSYAKKIRNTYPLGSHQMEGLKGFLDSRGHKMPGGAEGGMFGKADGENGVPAAWWYDALEIMDYCLGWTEEKDVKEGNQDAQKPVENRTDK